MSLQRGNLVRIAVRVGALALALLLMCVLMIHGPLAAQQLVALRGSHYNLAFNAELSEDKVLAGEVIMALNHTYELNQLAADLQNRDSPRYHKWLTPAQFAERFGPTSQQMQAVASWLSSQGLTVTHLDRITRTVQFNGSYARARSAFGVKITTDGQRYANVNDPQVPADLAPSIMSIEGLIGDGGADASRGDTVIPCDDCGDKPHFGPSDLYTFYDENSVLSGGNLGTDSSNCPETKTQDCVAMIEDSSVNPAAFSTFVAEFATALPSPAGTMPAIAFTTAPTSVATPGLPSDSEPYLDLEWVHAVSPNTLMRVYYTNGSGRYIGAIKQAVTENLCGAISSSTEDSTCLPPSSLNSLSSYELQAATQGQTILKSSGDYGSNWYCGNPNLGAATVVPSGYPSPSPYPQTGCGHDNYADKQGNVWQPSVDEQATSPNITVVGGTEFQPEYSPLPSPAVDVSTASPGFEVVWNGNGTPASTPTANANCAAKDASGGGPSQIFAKPPWQKNGVTPDDGSRDIPDVAMGASSNKPGFFVVSQTLPASTAGNPSPTPNPLAITLTGGTSIATPMWAGISRLIAHAQGVCRLGNINNRLYELGTLELPSPSPSSTPSNSNLGLVDVVSGDNSDAGVPGYNAGPGYDLTTGWGSPDIAKLIAAFPGAITSTSPVNSKIALGGSGGAGTFTVQNTTSGPLKLKKITISVSNHAVLSFLSVAAKVDGGKSSTTFAPASKLTNLVFSLPPTIPSMGTATLVLTAFTGGSSPSGTITPSEGGDSPSGGGKGIVALAFLALLASMWLARTRSRAGYALSLVLVLACLSFVASNCGSGSSSAGAKGVSNQAVPQGGIDLDDGQQGDIQSSGLPGSLGSVTVN